MWIEIYYIREPGPHGWSSSAWRMWIEILSAGTVIESGVSHPPHGGCGLKFVEKAVEIIREGHPPHGGCGLK